jgi:hypothetical protein
VYEIRVYLWLVSSACAGRIGCVMILSAMGAVIYSPDLLRSA